MASFSSSASRSLSQALPSTWSSDRDRPPSPGAPSCATTRRTSRPWICSLLRPLALICSMALSLLDWPAGAWSGLPSPQIPLPSGLECLDHFVILGEAHLRRILGAYAAYYNVSRTHHSLEKDAPFSRPVQRAGSINSHAILGGLHHHYVRV